MKCSQEGMKCIRNGMNDIAKMGPEEIFPLSKYTLSPASALNKNISCKNVVGIYHLTAKKLCERDPCPGIGFSSYDFAGQ